jgi:alkaline phosphatase D
MPDTSAVASVAQAAVLWATRATRAALAACIWLAAAWMAPPVAAQLLATGDPHASGAVLWARVPAAGAFVFEVSQEAHFSAPQRRVVARADEDTGLTMQVEVAGLASDTRYHWRLVQADGAADGTPLPARASFVTAPGPAEPRPVKVLFGADLGGQGYGRLMPGNPSKLEGWPVFGPMREESADFFVALGDMLYSDRPVTAQAPDPAYPKGNAFQIPKPGPGHVATLDDFRRDWLYHREDPLHDRFLRTTPLVATWDDHELVNDSGLPELLDGPTAQDLQADARLRQGDPARPRIDGKRQSVFYNPALAAAGRRAMFEWNPIPVLPATARADPASRRLYRSLRWGAHLELFVLDTRSYRDPRYRRDTDAAPKTMLGAMQKAWLLDGLRRSTATWQVVVSSVPLSIEGGSERDAQGQIYRDSWPAGNPGNPYGYARELREIAQAIAARPGANVLFLTGDQHFTNLFAYDVNGDGRVDFHEANTGSLRAGAGSGQVDLTLNPRRLYTDEGRVEHTYGALRIEGESGRLVVQFHDAAGRERPGARLELEPRR